MYSFHPLQLMELASKEVLYSLCTCPYIYHIGICNVFNKDDMLMMIIVLKHRLVRLFSTTVLKNPFQLNIVTD